MLGRLEDGILIYAPKQVLYKGNTILNPSNEILKDLGYKYIVDTEKPITNEFQYLTERYTETNVITIHYDINLIDYNEAVNQEIKKQYSDSQEFAILRQKNTKPEDYQTYYNYCESCKNKVKQIYNL